ncbi:MAG: hypothetical protein ACYC9O_10515 [Candidatus Latescibacterota bacterium]
MKELKLDKFDLEWPGFWIAGEDRDWAFETQGILHHVEMEFIIAVTAFFCTGRLPMNQVYGNFLNLFRNTKIA